MSEKADLELLQNANRMYKQYPGRDLESVEGKPELHWRYHISDPFFISLSAGVRILDAKRGREFWSVRAHAKIPRVMIDIYEHEALNTGDTSGGNTAKLTRMESGGRDGDTQLVLTDRSGRLEVIQFYVADLLSLARETYGRVPEAQEAQMIDAAIVQLLGEVPPA